MVRRSGRLLLLTVLLVVLVLPECALGDKVYPSVTFSFDSATFTYSYTVKTNGDNTDPFGFIQVDMLVPSSWVTQVSGPWVAGEDKKWAWFQGNWQQACDYVCWQSTQEQQIPSQTVWEGVFRLVVPNSVPAYGYVYTKDGGSAYHPIQLMVPAVPEPGSLSVLLIGCSGLVGFWVRKLRR